VTTIFYGRPFLRLPAARGARETGATVFGYQVRDPSATGSSNSTARAARSARGKPKRPSRRTRSRAVLLRQQVIDIAAPPEAVAPRELEITDVNRTLSRARAAAGREARARIAWLDTGTTIR